MKISQFFSAGRIIKQVLDHLQTSKVEAIADRVSDNWENGVVTSLLNNMAIIGKDVDSTLIDFFHIKIDTGIGYKNGERLLIDNASITYNASRPADTTDDGLGNLISTPHSTGSKNIPLTVGSINYIYIAYLLTTDETQFTLHKITKAKQFYKRTDGYEISVNTTGINPDAARFVFLGQVDLTGLNQAITSNISTVNRDIFRTKLKRIQIETPNIGKTDRPATYNIGNNKFFLDDHIKAVGTGVISPTNAHGLTLQDIGVGITDTVSFHRINEHTNGLIAGTQATPYPLISAMNVVRVQVSPGNDFITIKALLSTELAIINGLVFTSTNFASDVNMTFEGDPAGTYNIYFDSVSGLVAKTTTSIANSVTKLWLATITWDPTIPGDGNLSVPFDRRRFGTINLLQRWVTSARPPTPQSGNYGYNFDTDKLEYYNGTTWISLP